MSAPVTVAIQVRIAWWLKPYVKALVFFCKLHGTEPDWAKLERTTKRATRVRTIRGGAR